MAISYKLDADCMARHEDVGEAKSDPILILTRPEFDELTIVSPEVHEEIARLEKNRTNFISMFPHHYIGSLAIPVRGDPSSNPELISFYLDTYNLIFVTETSTIPDILDKIANKGALHDLDCARCLFYILNELLADDLGWLAKMEDEMEDAEEQMLKGKRTITPDATMNFRRIASAMGSFYQEIGDTASILSDDSNGVLSSEATQKFKSLARHCDRLGSRTDTLKEYSLQLRELYQTKLDERQNYIMGVFTIVTVVIAPLTLMTGWFGMNVSAPGMQWEYTWIVLLGCGIVTSIGITIFVKWRKWI